MRSLPSDRRYHLVDGAEREVAWAESLADLSAVAAAHGMKLTDRQMRELLDADDSDCVRTEIGHVAVRLSHPTLPEDVVLGYVAAVHDVVDESLSFTDVCDGPESARRAGRGLTEKLGPERHSVVGLAALVPCDERGVSVRYEGATPPVRTIWALVSRTNDYDQPDGVLRAWWTSHPTRAQLAAVLPDADDVVLLSLMGVLPPSDPRLRREHPTRVHDVDYSVWELDEGATENNPAEARLRAAHRR